MSRRPNNDDTANKRTDDNQQDRIDQFLDQIKNKLTYSIHLSYVCDLGKINFPTKLDMKIRLTLETELKNLFETNMKVANIGTTDAQIILLKAPYLQYEQIVPAKNFRQYLESILFSAKVLRMGVQKTPYLKT